MRAVHQPDSPLKNHRPPIEGSTFPVRWYRWTLSLCIVCTACWLNTSRAWAGAIIDGANVRVTDAALNGANVNHVRMVEHNGTLYVVWEDERDGNHSSVYFAKSTDGGATWGANVRVSSLPYDDWVNYPDIAVQPDGTIWVVWHLYYDNESNQINDVRIAKSTDGGTTFSRDTLANGNNEDSYFWRSRIVADASNGELYVMLQIYGVNGEDKGMNFALMRYIPASNLFVPVDINDIPRGGRIGDSLLDYGAWFSLTARNGVVCAAWEDRGRTDRESQPIYGACSNDRGATFAPDFKISENSGIHPEIAIGPDNQLYTAYALDTDSHRNIKLRYSTNLGVNWTPGVPVTAVDAFEVRDWVVAVDANGQVLLAYVYDLGSSSDLYLTTSIDHGTNFGSVILEDAQGQFPTVADQLHPALAVGGTGNDARAYVVWEDDRNVTDELWSARTLLDSLAPTVPANLTVTPAERALRLSWDASGDSNGVVGYHVFRATTAVGQFAEITARLVEGTAYVDVELDVTTYFYTVAAVDSTGNTSAPSAPVSGAATAAGAPTFGGKLAYQAGTAIRVRNLIGDPAERTLSDARQPRFAANGERVYFLSQETISSQPVDGGAPTLFFSNEGLAEYDLADNDSHYGALIGRTFAAPGVVGGVCIVTEPHYGRPGQDIYTEQYEYASEIALSSDRKWLVYRTQGFCTIAGSGTYSPPRLCLIDLTTTDDSCLEGFDYRTPDFAPTGHWIAFAVDFSGQTEIWKAQVQENGTLSNYVQLTRGAANQPARAPAWSTDGNWLAFQRDIDPAATEDWRLFVVRNDGVGVRALDLAGEYPAWLGGGPSAPPTGDKTLHLPILLSD